jgi:predicted HicB family RNase H-like nuclease
MRILGLRHFAYFCVMKRSNKLVSKDFVGSVHYSSSDNIFYGRIDGITDLVTFEGDNVIALKLAFEEAVDDYVALCDQLGKTPFKSFKGSFNVRLTPQLHAKAFKQATLRGQSLNQYVLEAIEKQVVE